MELYSKKESKWDMGVCDDNPYQYWELTITKSDK